MNAAPSYFEPIVTKERRKNCIIAIVLLLLCGGGAAWGFSLDFNEVPAARMSVLFALIAPILLFSLVWNVLPHRGLAAWRWPRLRPRMASVKSGGRPL